MKYSLKQILATVDHTALAQDATWETIQSLCDDGVRYQTASVCIPPCYVADAASYLAGRLPVCTVIGFPNGNMTRASKCFETADAVAKGAEEIDMVINIGYLRDGRDREVAEEIRAVKDACDGKLLKVIIETCLLTDEEKVRMCHLVAEGGADFIKTSTGFSKAGATFHDIELFAANVPEGLRIKAAGGISSIEDAERFLSLGAHRLGTSRIVKIVKQMEAEGLAIE